MDPTKYRDRDLYAVFGVDSTADPRALKSAYRRLMMRYHPDRHPGDPLAEKRAQKINAWWEILSNPEMRARYDRARAEFLAREAEQASRRALAEAETKREIARRERARRRWKAVGVGVALVGVASVGWTVARRSKERGKRR